MDVVFYLEIWFSYGEREHALSLARQIGRAGFLPRFVVEPRVADHIRDAGFEAEAIESPAAGLAAVRRIDPVAVIGCELFNLSDLAARGLIATGIPLATVDGTTLGIEINTDPFLTPRLTRSLVLPESYFSFRPCPVNDLAPDTERICHYALFPEATRVAKDDRTYAALGLDPVRQTVLLPIASWAINGAKLAGLGGYYDRLLDTIVRGLVASGDAIDLVVVAKFDAVRESFGPVRLHVIDHLPQATYEHLLRSCDAVVSDNIIQTSVSRAVVMGTPHLVIHNTPPETSASATGRGGLLPPELPYRSNIFPVRRLFPPDREYARLVEVAEFAAPDDVRDKLVALLRDGVCDAERDALRRAYRERLRGLADPGVALARMLALQNE